MWLDERMSDGLCRHKGIRHDAAKEITFSCNAKLTRPFEAYQGGTGDEIDPAAVVREAVVFTSILKAHQGSDPSGNLCSGDPLMIIDKPASRRRIADHDMVHQAQPLSRRVIGPQDTTAKQMQDQSPDWLGVPGFGTARTFQV